MSKFLVIQFVLIGVVCYRIFVLEKKLAGRKATSIVYEDFKRLFLRYRNYVSSDSHSPENRFDAVRLVEKCEAEIERLIGK